MPKPPRIAELECRELIGRRAGISLWSAFDNNATAFTVLSFGWFAKPWPLVFSNLQRNQLSVRVAKEASGRVALVVQGGDSASGASKQSPRNLGSTLADSKSFEKFYVDYGWIAQDSQPQLSRASHVAVARKPWVIGLAAATLLSATVLVAAVWVGQPEAPSKSRGNPGAASPALPSGQSSKPPRHKASIAQTPTFARVRSLLLQSNPFTSAKFDADLALDALVANQVSATVVRTISLGGFTELRFSVEGVSSTFVASYGSTNNEWSLLKVEAQN